MTLAAAHGLCASSRKWLGGCAPSAPMSRMKLHQEPFNGRSWISKTEKHCWLDTTRAINNGKDLAVWWWLRSLAEGGTQAYYVNFEGRMYTNLVANGYLSVRPALWVDCEAADLTDSSK